MRTSGRTWAARRTPETWPWTRPAIARRNGGFPCSARDGSPVARRAPATTTRANRRAMAPSLHPRHAHASTCHFSVFSYLYSGRCRPNGCNICSESYRLKTVTPGFLASVILWFGLAGNIGFAGWHPAPQDPVQPRLVSSHTAPTQTNTSQAKAAPPAAQEPNAVVRRYCATCHSEARKSGGLSLASFDIAQAAQNAEVSEKMIRKL